MTPQNEELVADYDVRSPASRTLLTVLGTILTVAIIAGLILGASILKRDTIASTSDIELAGSAPVVIDAGSSDLKIVQGAPGQMRVTARITSGLRKTDFQMGRRGNRIKIVSGCQSWLNPGCGVETTLAVPKGIPVEIVTTTGNVSVRNVTEGVLNIRTGSGDIAGSGLVVDELEAETASGNITAAFESQPFGVKATSRSGDIRATMADGKRTYVVTATSKSGNVSSGVTSVNGGDGFIRVKTGSGDVSIKHP